MLHVFDYAMRATKGMRDYQEDMAKVWSGGGVAQPPDRAVGNGHPNDDARADIIAVLADGMGGHAGGALASQLVCDTFVGAYTSSHGDIPDRLFLALNDANGAVADRVEEEPGLAGMGSTVIGVSFGSHGVHWVSVGDSPLLLFRRGEIAHLNEDHSLAPELDRLAEAGKISLEEARRDPRRSMLRSAVTGDEMDLIDRSRKALELATDDYVILASDGLQSLEVSEVERIVAAYASDGCDAVAAALIRAVEAMRDPHQDNATVVVVKVLARARDGLTETPVSSGYDKGDTDTVPNTGGSI